MYCDYLENNVEKYVEEDKITKDQWLGICKSIYSDKDNLDLFLKVLRNSNYF